MEVAGRAGHPVTARRTRTPAVIRSGAAAAAVRSKRGKAQGVENGGGPWPAAAAAAARAAAAVEVLRMMMAAAESR